MEEKENVFNLKEFKDAFGKVDMGDVSDGYHTFNELYHHRAVLFSVICNQNARFAWKSKLHSDGTMYDNMFIVGMNLPIKDGLYPISYHYDIYPYWDMFQVKEIERAQTFNGNMSCNGYTSWDVADRLERFAFEVTKKPNLQIF